MTPETSADALRQFFRDAGVDLSTATCGEMVETALQFYGEVRANGLSKSRSNDMLLFQHGICRSLRPDYFQLDVTRQFSQYDTEDGNAPTNEDEYYGDLLSQLSCRALFPKSASLEAFRNADRWCERPEDLESLRAAMLASPAFQLVRDLRPASIEIDWWEV